MRLDVQPTEPDVAAYRARRFRVSGEERLESLEAAERFVEDCGLVLLVASGDLLLPSLAGAVSGAPYSFVDWDWVMDRIWSWKNLLAARRRIACGKLIKDRLFFVAPDVLEALYVLAARDGRAPAGAPAADRVSRDALRVYQALLDSQATGQEEGGGMGAKALRKAAGFGGKGGYALFNRALIELQRGLYILQSGAAEEGSAWTSNRYDLLARMFPDIPGAEHRTTSSEARVTLVRRYLDAVVLAAPKQIQAALGLPRAAVAEALDTLSAAGVIRLDREAPLAWKAAL